MELLDVKTRAAWRRWLAENHDSESEIWLVYYKKATGLPSIGYGESVEEALCFGWVDSLIRRLDEQRYARKFTPRKDDSNWSESNKKRVIELIEQGRMTEVGLAKVAAAKESGRWQEPDERPELTFAMHPDFAAALEKNAAAKTTYEALATTYQKQYLTWIETAKRADTRARRIAESIQLLAQRKKLGLK